MRLCELEQENHHLIQESKPDEGDKAIHVFSNSTNDSIFESDPLYMTFAINYKFI